MKNLTKKFFIYGILAVAALLIEVFIFNYQPLFNKTEDVVIDLNSRDTTWKYNISESGKSLIVDLAEPTYYRKLDINFSKKYNCYYDVQMEFLNDFDSKETVTIEERKIRGLTRGVTNLGERVTSIKITITSNYGGEIAKIKLTNHVQLNKYRCLFVYLLFFIVAFFWLEKELFRKRLEIVFLVLGTALSAMFCYAHGIQENGWDDDVHFKYCYYLSYGEKVPVTETVEAYVEKIDYYSYNTLEEMYLVTDLMNENHNLEEAEYVEGYPFTYKHLNYALEILAMKIGHALDWSFSSVYMLAKWVNLIAYMLLMALAIRLAKNGKIYLVFLGLIPLNMFVAGTVTYNSQILGLLTLAMVLWMNEMLEPERKVNKKNLIWLLICFGIGASAKLIYVPLIMLIGLFPNAKFKNDRQKRQIITAFVIISCIAVALFAGPILIKLLSGGATWPGDSRGGNTDIILQLKSIFMHPISYLRMFVDNFVEKFGDFFLGRDGYGMFGRYSRLPERFGYVITLLVVTVALVQPEEDSVVWLSKKQKGGVIICVVLTIALIWLSMYLAYTPVGTSTIKGVQGRYYAEILLPLFLVCQNDKLVWKISKVRYDRIVIGVLCFLNLYSLYAMIIQPWIL